MGESISQFFTSGDVWAVIIKVLITTLLSAATAWIGTLIANKITKNKDSKIYKYAKTLVEAAEQKFPNEGVKMGPQKLEYVMSQIVIRFPKVKDNQYLYNIVEQAVYKLNEKRNQDLDAQAFFDKYGEWPQGYEPPIIEENTNDAIINNDNSIIEDNEEKIENINNMGVVEAQQQSASTAVTQAQQVKKKKLSSF